MSNANVAMPQSVGEYSAAVFDMVERSTVIRLRRMEHPALEGARHVHAALGVSAARLLKAMAILRRKDLGDDGGLALELLDEAAESIGEAHIDADGVVLVLEGK